LISFLLAPVVSRLERWGLHPVLPVFGVATIAFALIGALCATMSLQSLDLVNSIPKYRNNLHAKWAAIQKGPSGPLNPTLRNLGTLTDDLSRVTAPSREAGKLEPTKVQIVSSADGALELVKNSVTPVLGSAAELAVIVVLVVLTLGLRFLPYVGLWLSAFFPFVLSIAISTTWKEPILTLGLYCFLEVFTNNVVEPIVLGGSAGMSPLAVIVSALFWTWLWGPIGLLLATPLTASLVGVGSLFSGLPCF
jgi:predicted PurR-regulated permease PerM